MWKESYRLGIESIDHQHMELFQVTDRLLAAIENQAQEGVFLEIITFLKEYAVKHFREEEAYQESIHYSGLKAHKQEHQKFTHTVLDFEEKLISSDFDLSIIKDLAGTLTAWLTYHVAGEDQKITAGETAHSNKEQGACIDLVSHTAFEVMETMAGVTLNRVSAIDGQDPKVQNGILIDIGFVGDIQDQFQFYFSKELAFHLIEAMTFMKPSEIDEIVTSAVSEITNITCGKASIALSENGTACDITTPCASSGAVEIQAAQGVQVSTSAGDLQIFVA